MSAIKRWICAWFGHKPTFEVRPKNGRYNPPLYHCDRCGEAVRK
jgi:hypothetical protein